MQSPHRALAKSGLKAQKHTVQGKQSDTLGNAYTPNVCALKGQKHKYAETVSKKEHAKTTHEEHCPHSFCRFA